MKMCNTTVNTSLSPERYMENLNQYIDTFGNGKQTHTRHIAACHETGHTLVAHILNCKPKSTEIWKEPNGDWCGYTRHKPQGEIHAINSPEKIIIEIMIACAGWIAEGIIGNVIDHGSSADERLKVVELSASLSEHNGWNHQVIIELCILKVTELVMKNKKEIMKLAENIRLRKTVTRQEINRTFSTVPIDKNYHIANSIIDLIRNR